MEKELSSSARKVQDSLQTVGHTTPIETFIDELLFRFTEIWAAARTPHAVFRLSPSELKLITGGTVVSVSQ
jgi:prolyl-tRNA editing enzyme YbaK/EbsC (Cys-tRNA(Pro) deacylase)